MTDFRLKLASTLPALKLQIATPHLQCRITPFFPGSVVEGTGIDIISTGGVFTVSWNATEAGFSAFGLQLGAAVDGAAARALLGGAVGVAGPPSSTDNAIARWDAVSGTTLQNSSIIIDDSNNLTIPNASWLKGRNVGDSANLSMFRINSQNYTEFFNPIYYDENAAFIDRKAVFTLTRNIAAPTGIIPSIVSIVEGKGDNATFIGVSGGYFQARDRTDVTALNKGVLYALQLSVVPQIDRSNFPFDDAVGLIVSNDGSKRGTEAIYIGHNVTGGGRDFQAGIGLDVHTSEAVIYVTGQHAYGLDFARAAGATFSNAAIRLKNNHQISSRNAANDTDFELLRFDSGNNLVVGLAVLSNIPRIGTGASNGNTVLLQAYDVDGASYTTFATLTAANTPTMDLSSAVTQGGSAIPKLATGQTWTAQQIISLSSSFAIPLYLISTNADAVAGPIIALDRQSASPAVNDNIGIVDFRGKDDGGNTESYAQIAALILDPTNTSEDGRLSFATMVAGAFGDRVLIQAGMMIGAPTGGDQGAGTLNLDNNLFKDGTQVVSNRVTGYTAFTGTNTNRATAYDTATITLVQLAERVRALQIDLTAHGLVGA